MLNNEDHFKSNYYSQYICIKIVDQYTVNVLDLACMIFGGNWFLRGFELEYS